MPVTVTHATVATAADDPDAEINKAEWNADHVVVGGIQSATVTLSSADLLDLHNTPVTLVAAPGAGEYIQVADVKGWLAFGTTQYAGDDPFVYIDWDGLGFSSLFGAADGSESGLILFSTANLSNITLPAAGIVDKALVATASAALTDGDSAITVTVLYTVEDVPA